MSDPNTERGAPLEPAGSYSRAGRIALPMSTLYYSLHAATDGGS